MAAHRFWSTRKTQRHCCTWKTCSGSARCRHRRTRRAFQKHRRRRCGHTEWTGVRAPCAAACQPHCQTSLPPACRNRSRQACHDYQSPTVNNSPLLHHRCKYNKTIITTQMNLGPDLQKKILGLTQEKFRIKCDSRKTKEKLRINLSKRKINWLRKMQFVENNLTFLHRTVCIYKS